MKQLVLPGMIAITIHIGLFMCNLPWAAPDLPAPRSRAVNISLAKMTKPKPPTPAPQTVITAPEPPPQPKPKPLAKPKPAVKPIPKAPLPVKPYKSKLPQMAGIQPLTPLAEPPPELPVTEGSPGPGSLTTSDPTSTPVPVDDREGADVQVAIPVYELNPPPPYPRVASRRNYEGTVILDVLVTREGRATDIRLHQSSGYAVLDRSAEKHVQSWRFQPAKRGGKTIEMRVKVPVLYKLHD